MKIDPTLHAALTNEARPQKAGGTDFAQVMDDAIRAVDDKQNIAAEKAIAGAKGEVDFHDVAMAMEEADLSMRVMMKVRNKIVEAYQEVMRMPV